MAEVERESMVEWWRLVEMAAELSNLIFQRKERMGSGDLGGEREG